MERTMAVMLAALLHDIGKAPATFIDDAGEVKATGHAEAGVPLARAVLERFGVDNLTADKTLRLVQCHMRGFELYKARRVRTNAVRKLARDLHPATIEELAFVMIADRMGRGTEEADWLLEQAASLNVTAVRPVDVITGKDLIAAGHKPGKDFGKVIALCNALHEDHSVEREYLLTFIADANLEEIVRHLQALRRMCEFLDREPVKSG